MAIKILTLTVHIGQEMLNPISQLASCWLIYWWLRSNAVYLCAWGMQPLCWCGHMISWALPSLGVAGAALPEPPDPSHCCCGRDGKVFTAAECQLGSFLSLVAIGCDGSPFSLSLARLRQAGALRPSAGLQWSSHRNRLRQRRLWCHWASRRSRGWWSLSAIIPIHKCVAPCPLHFLWGSHDPSHCCQDH